MFEVKFPNSHNFDGKTHIIIIKDVEYVDGHIFVYGKTKDLPHLIIELKYMKDLSSWVMVPRKTTEIVEMFKKFKGKSIDLTDYIKSQIDGLQLTNIEELDYVFPVKNEKIIENNDELVIRSWENDLEKIFEETKQHVFNNYHNILDEDEFFKENAKNYLYRTPESLPIDVMDLLSINKRKAYRLIDTFLEVNEYQNIKREKAIVDLIEVLFNVLLEYPDSIFTEDNLIDLGNLLMRLNYQRVNMYDDNSFENIINMGYELIDSLNMKIKHK